MPVGWAGDQGLPKAGVVFSLLQEYVWKKFQFLHLSGDRLVQRPLVPASLDPRAKHRESPVQQPQYGDFRHLTADEPCIVKAPLLWNDDRKLWAPYWAKGKTAKCRLFASKDGYCFSCRLGNAPLKTPAAVTDAQDQPTDLFPLLADIFQRYYFGSNRKEEEEMLVGIEWQFIERFRMLPWI